MRLRQDQLGPILRQKTPMPGGNDDFLGRLNKTIENIKGLIEMLPPGAFPGLGTIPGQKTLPIGQGPPVVIDGMPPGKGAKAPPPPPAPPMVGLFKAFLEKNGEQTIGQMLETLSPVTLKEVAEVLKNVGLIK